MQGSTTISMTMMPHAHDKLCCICTRKRAGLEGGKRREIDRLVPGSCNKDYRKGMPTYHTRVATDGWVPVEICSRQAGFNQIGRDAGSCVR